MHSSQHTKVILFDLDGTLIDSTEAILESFDVAFSSFKQLTPPKDEIKAQIGYPLDEMFVTLGVEGSKAEQYVEAYKMHYRSISCEKTVLLPKARETIELAHKHATLGVVTTKTAKYSREILEHMGVMHYFDVLIGREDVEHPKPHPQPIQKALEKLPTSNDVTMIGDTCMDIMAAKNAEVKSVAVLCGYGTKESLEQCASVVVDDALEAVRYITS